MTEFHTQKMHFHIFAYCLLIIIGPRKSNAFFKQSKTGKNVNARFVSKRVTPDPRRTEARFPAPPVLPLPVPRTAMAPTEAAAILPTGPEPEEVDVNQFYVKTESLEALADPEVEAAALLPQLDSDVWTVVCGGLLVARRLAFHHPDVLLGILDAVVVRLRAHMNSLRSSLCKTALICCADVLRAYGDAAFEFLEDTGEGKVDGSGPVAPSLMHTLLHKAALDKRFVMDEAKRTLLSMIERLDPDALVREILLSRVESKNDKVRAVVAMCLREAVDKSLRRVTERAARGPETETDDDEESGFDAEASCAVTERDALLRAAASFVNDRQPAAREHARSLLETLKRSHVERAEVENGGDAWQTHVERTLGKSVAVKIVKLC